MKHLFKTNIIIIPILIGILILQQCENNKKNIDTIAVDGKEYELLSQKIDTVIVEKEVKVTEYIPRIIYKTDTIKIEVPIKVDTLSILKDYFASYTIVDTLKLNYEFEEGVTTEEGTPSSTLGYGILTDIVSQNKIQSRKVDWAFEIPTIYNTITVKELPKTELYWGLNAGFDKINLLNNVGGSLLLKTKSQRIYELEMGVGYDGYQYSPVIAVGKYWKLFPKE